MGLVAELQARVARVKDKIAPFYPLETPMEAIARYSQSIIRFEKIAASNEAALRRMVQAETSMGNSELKRDDFNWAKDNIRDLERKGPTRRGERRLFGRFRWETEGPLLG